MAKTVTVIGAGPSGMAAARSILAESPDFTIRIFEARADFGGLWNYSPVHGPMYRNLDANVARDLIGFTDFPFPGQGVDDSYPSRQDVLDYIRNYSREVSRDQRISVFFNTKVDSVVKDKSSRKWITTTGHDEVFESDFLLLATGHYEFPFWPSIRGLRSHSGSLHSVDYDSPDEFTGKRVLVLGNSRSGTDIVIQILSRTAPITVSRRKVGPVDHIFDDQPGSVVWKPEIQKVIGHAVYFSDGTCEVYDRVLVCTGYLYDFPFLKQEPEDGVLLLDKQRLRLHNFYRHTIYAGDSSLATLGMNKGMVPFPTFETQGEVIAKVWNGRLKVPDLSIVQEEEKIIAEARGKAEKFHDLPMELDVNFMQMLWNWSDEAPSDFKVDRWDLSRIDRRKTALQAKEKHDVSNLVNSIQSRLQLEKLVSP